MAVFSLYILWRKWRESRHDSLLKIVLRYICLFLSKTGFWHGIWEVTLSLYITTWFVIEFSLLLDTSNRNICSAISYEIIQCKVVRFSGILWSLIILRKAYVESLIIVIVHNKFNCYKPNFIFKFRKLSFITLPGRVKNFQLWWPAFNCR